MGNFRSAGPVLLLVFAGIRTSAQAPSVPPAATAAATETEKPIQISVTNIVAPVLVTDRSGRSIDELQPHEFQLFDNGEEQNINVDVAFEPISLVVLMERSSRVEAILPQMKRLGSLLPLVLGDSGEAAVLAFDSRFQLMQDFTPDSDRIKAAIDKITPGNSSARMIDAVDQAVLMLKNRPGMDRKIILLVSETRDIASDGKLRETLINAQFANVLVYTLNITQLAVRLTEKPEPPRPDPIAVTAIPGVMGNPSTPTTAFQNYGPNLAQFGPLFMEIYKGMKGLFVDNPSEVFAKGTGGEQFSFLRQKGLENAVQRIGLEIRSQYLISYHPNNASEPGFHRLVVVVKNPSYVTKTRPGYWIGGGKSE